MKHYFEYQDSKSYKFWQVEIETNTLNVKYGKIGTAGQEKISSFDTPEKAQKEMEKLIGEKIKKGYKETKIITINQAPFRHMIKQL